MPNPSELERELMEKELYAKLADIVAKRLGKEYTNSLVSIAARIHSKDKNANS